MSCDLELEIAATGEPGVYRVDADSPAGAATGELRLDVGSLLDRRRELGACILASAVNARGGLAEQEQGIREVGQMLFERLFAERIYGRYTATAQEATRCGEPLRVVLRLRVPELAALPWETMFDAEANEYLCQREPVVRYVETAQAVAPLGVDPPLRILGLIAAPRDLPTLDVEEERKRLEQALAGMPRDAVELVWADGGDWPRLQEKLAAGPWHVLHFIGHGGVDPASDGGVLWLEDERTGLATSVSASRFSRLLHVCRPVPRLVVLNSCQSGEAAADDLLSSTAAALVNSGISAVIAMQFAITDPAALAFARGFYQALSQNALVDEAVRLGRIAIDGTGERTLEWVTPVLYLRTEDTRLFAIGERKPATASAAGEPAQNGTLQSLYVEAMAALRTGREDEAIVMLDSLLTLDPHYRDAAERRNAARRSRRLASGYERAHAAEDADDWKTALAEYSALEEDYRDVAARRAVCERRQRIAELQEELRLHAEAGHWDAMASIVEELNGLDADAADVEAFASLARERLGTGQAPAEPAPPAGGAIVDASGGGDQTSLAAAVRSAAPGSRITVRAGIYDAGTIAIDKPLEITGDGLRERIVLRNDSGRVLRCSAAGVKISNLTLRGGGEAVIDVLAGELAADSCAIVVDSGCAVRVTGGAELRLRGNRIRDPAQDAPPGGDEVERVETIGLVANAGARVSLDHDEISGMFGYAFDVSDPATTLVARDLRVARNMNPKHEASRVTQGAQCTLEHCELAETGGAGIFASGAGTALTLQASALKRCGGVGVIVDGDAVALLEDCKVSECAGSAVCVQTRADLNVRGGEFWACRDGGVWTLQASTATLDGAHVFQCEQKAGIVVCGEGARATIRSCRVHDTRGTDSGNGIGVSERAHALVENTEIYANARHGLAVWGATVEARSNRVHDHRIGAGIFLDTGATGELSGNDIRDNKLDGVIVKGAGTSATLADNSLAKNGQAGASVIEKASAVIEANHVVANAQSGVSCLNSAVTIRGNTISDNGLSGVYRKDSTGDIVDNQIRENHSAGISFASGTSADGRVANNHIVSNRGGAMAGVVPDVGHNDLGLAGDFKGDLAEIAQRLEDGDESAADNRCIELIRAAAGNVVIDSMAIANKVPKDLLEPMDQLWRRTRGAGLGARPWVARSEAGVTTLSFIDTYLLKRLKQSGLRP